jgi:hypothetical protein
MDIDKKINKSIKFLKKYTKSNKIADTDTNFVFVFLLYCQLKYKIKFNISTSQNIEPKLFDCCKYLYGNMKQEDLESKLFEENEILSDIFKITTRNDTKKSLKKIMNKINSINYINLNIEILDYLGNVSSDVDIINCGYGLIWLKEINPDIKISKKFYKALITNLINVATRQKDSLRYTNSEAILILFLLNKILYMPELEEWIKNLSSKQKIDGRWTNGYNSYFIDNIELYDTYHTIVGLLILLEYKTLEHYKNKDFEEEENLIEDEGPNTEIKLEKPNIKFLDNEIPNIIEGFENKKPNIFELEKVIPLSDKYTIHYNIYNVSFLVFLIFLIYYVNKSPIQQI